MEVGVLALQGDVREHRAALAAVGVTAREVRRPADLDGLGGIVLPGGESTTLSMLLESSGLFEPLGAAIGGGLP
ncbi:MAG: pyridoxal 5'-phosphate synthase glutaminase subunit PdxT, partial [Acidimicrobiales bacterium]